MRLRGFTVIELVIVMGLMTVLLSGFLAIGSMLQNSVSVRSHKNISALVVEASVRARNAVNNSDWGVYFTTNATTNVLTSITVFSGESYATRDTTRDLVIPIDAAAVATFALSNVSPYTGNGKELVFEQGTADPHITGVITIQTGTKTSTITVTPAGAVLYAR